MPAVTVTISREAHARLVEEATRERRRLYAQAGLMLERLLLEDTVHVPVPPNPKAARNGHKP